jgi:hypothetical protein
MLVKVRCCVFYFECLVNGYSEVGGSPGLLRCVHFYVEVQMQLATCGKRRRCEFLQSLDFVASFL